MMSHESRRRTLQPDRPAGAGPWSPALAILEEWDPDWAELCARMAADPWATGVLPRKTVELIGVALSAACTNLDPDGTRRFIRAALDAGASREEILMVLKMASVMAIHSGSLGAPILLEEARAAGVAPGRRASGAATPACDRMRAAGRWDEAWDPLLALDPAWTEQFAATAAGIHFSGVLTAKVVELLSVALAASCTHLDAPGTRRHIRAALELGATVEEIVQVLKLCVVHGTQACNLGVPILAAEISEHVARETRRT
jgi:alkylhydroperoxidase/carboxymuconolactone decarboxylase family protein YurZ